MKSRHLLGATAGLLFCGCLNFGEDVLTSEPTPAQVEYCRAELHLMAGLEIEPIGLKIIGSGIDDAVWFVFRTTESDHSLIFDPSVIPADSLRGRVAFFWDESMPEWWDTENRTFEGGTLALPAGKWITAGFAPAGNGTICYVFWHET